MDDTDDEPDDDAVAPPPVPPPPPLVLPPTCNFMSSVIAGPCSSVLANNHKDPASTADFADKGAGSLLDHIAVVAEARGRTCCCCCCCCC